MLVLKNAAGSPISILGYAKNVRLDLHLNETSVIEFSLPAFADGMPVPGYDEVVGFRDVEIVGIGQFKLIKPTEVGDGVKIEKQCKGYSVEFEFTQKKITLQNGTYKFWSIDGNQENTLLGMIMEKMPSWKVGTVSDTLYNKYRTFEVSGENLYNFIKSTVQQTYKCIFDFDTLTRTVNVIDVNDEVLSSPIYLSTSNLAKQIQIDEDTEGLVTRLDVSGAEGVSIRDVNPDGTNKIINLDYYMNPGNFPQTIIDKYFEWKNDYNANKQPYYALTIRYSAAVNESVAADAALRELEYELTALENELAVMFQAKEQNIEGVNDETISVKQAEIKAKNDAIDSHKTYIDTVKDRSADLIAQLSAINKACRFEDRFTPDEWLIIDRYLKDDEIAESTFAVSAVASYADVGGSETISTGVIEFSEAQIEHADNASNLLIYNITGGNVNISNISGQVISATIEAGSASHDLLISARLGECRLGDEVYPSGSITLSGSYQSFETDLSSDEDVDDWYTGTRIKFNILNTSRYFTLDTSEYDKRSVAWDLYEYGSEVLEGLSQPAYTFSIESANFLALEEFESFKNALTLGRKVYIENHRGSILKPICIGASVEYDSPSSLDLKFGDSYVATDSTFKMIDLLDQSISMGKTIDTSKYIYSAFVDSGADTEIKSFMNSALDISKNAIISSGDQAIGVDGAGIRLRKWKNEAKTAYDDEQIWMNNNSIMMTNDGWNTAEMAIGKFYDPGLGEICWGVIAPRIVGTMIAGTNLIIESAKTDGGIAVFRMDADGCRLYNSEFTVHNGETVIQIDPSSGIMIGKAPLFETDENGTTVIIEENRRFWADNEGNVFLKGHIEAESGTFHGELNAATGTFEGELVAATGTFSGDLEAAGGTFAGTLSASQLRVDNGDGTEFSVGDYITSTVANSKIPESIRTEVIQSEEFVRVKTFTDDANTWFTFHNELGFIVSKPPYIDEKTGKEVKGSIWSTITDNVGYHIKRSDVDEYIGSFTGDRLKVQGVEIGKIISKKTGTGGWVWTDA